ncbi:hypothetical protein BDW60DRAFT_191930 [Aspergillus nidulans var. acristatus]
MSLYKCTSCNEPIQSTRPRLSCASCTPRMTLCANCYVVGVYPSQHQDDESHSISMHIQSGFLPVPPPPPPRIQLVSRSLSAYGPPRRRPIPTTNTSSDVPPQMPPRPTKSEKEIRSEVEDSERGPPTPLPPRVVDPEHPQQLPRQDPPEYSELPLPTARGWTPLLTEEMKPSPSFTRVMGELFQHLDPQHTGFLSPEVYSQYIETCGAPPSYNIWKTSNTKSGTDIADRELADHFAAYSVDFTLRPRTPHSTSSINPLSNLPFSQHATLFRFMPQVPSMSGGQKPMLSPQGFSDLSLISVLLNPSSAWSQLSRVIKAYRIPVWLEWGDLPRDMLPLGPYQPEVERVRVLLEGARANAEEELDAVHARLKMEERGAQHALDLLDDRVWVYR